jgi:hypothetical protein
MTPRLYKVCFFAFLTILCMVFPGILRAGDPVVDISGSFDPQSLRESEHTVLSVSIEIPDDYHLYSMTKIPMGPLPLTIAVKENQLTPIGDWHGPKPTVAFDGNFKKAVEYHANKVV